MEQLKDDDINTLLELKAFAEANVFEWNQAIELMQKYIGAFEGIPEHFRRIMSDHKVCYTITKSPMHPYLRTLTVGQKDFQSLPSEDLFSSIMILMGFKGGWDHPEIITKILNNQRGAMEMFEWKNRNNEAKA